MIVIVVKLFSMLRIFIMCMMVMIVMTAMNMMVIMIAIIIVRRCWIVDLEEVWGQVCGG